MKGIAIILVILGHVCSNDFVVKFVYSFHLPIFMFVSGLLYKKTDILKNIKKMLKNIIIPYLLFGIIIMIYFFCFENKYRNVDLNIFEATFGLIFGHYDYLGFNVHIWYLPFFFMAVVLFNIISNVSNCKVARIIYYVLAFTFIFYKLPNLPFSINRFDLLFYFALGNLLKEKKYVKEYNFNIKTVIIAVISTTIIVLLNIFDLFDFGISYIIGISGIIMSWCISVMLSKYDKVLKIAGSSTLVILCCHGPIYRIYIKVLATIFKIESDIIRQNFIYCMIIVITTLFSGIIIHEIIYKFIPTICRKLKNNVVTS